VTGRKLVIGVPHKPQGDPKQKVWSLHSTLLPSSTMWNTSKG